MKTRRASACALVVAGAVLLTVGAEAKKRSTRGVASGRTRTDRPPEFPPDAAESRASHHAALSPDACYGELDRRDVRFHKAGPAPGVLMPVRLDGPVGGVLYRTDYADAQRPSVPFEVFDCRLVVALSDLGAILRAHEVEEVRIYSAWRPPNGSWPAGKIGDRHPGALAADLRLFRKSSGATLDVERDFHGAIGSQPCGPGAAPPTEGSAEARELREIYCAAADARLFHVLLSPNFDHEHRNHFHVEVRADVRWFIVR